MSGLVSTWRPLSKVGMLHGMGLMIPQVAIFMNNQNHWEHCAVEGEVFQIDVKTKITPLYKLEMEKTY